MLAQPSGNRREIFFKEGSADLEKGRYAASWSSRLSSVVAADRPAPGKGFDSSRAARRTFRAAFFRWSHRSSAVGCRAEAVSLDPMRRNPHVARRFGDAPVTPAIKLIHENDSRAAPRERVTRVLEIGIAGSHGPRHHAVRRGSIKAR